MKENIILTGFMASGKSTVAAELARISGMRLADTDIMIERSEGKTIPQIFEEHGEEYFRDRESEICTCAAKLEGYVISTGGGVVLREKNIEALRRNGMVFLLDVPFEIISKRLKNARDTRPLVSNDSMEGIERRYNDRKPFYDNCDCRVRVTEGLTAAETAEIIFKIFKGHL